MFDKEEYMKNIYEKYKNIDFEDSFYKTKFQKTKKTRVFNNFIIICMSIIGFTSAFAYSENNRRTINDNIENNSLVGKISDYKNIITKMELYDRSTYYKKITTYDEYVDATQIYGEITPMEKNDFNKYFLIIIANISNDMNGLYVSDVKKMSDEIIVSLERKEEYDSNDRLISVKVSKNLDCDKLKINVHSFNKNEMKYSDISSFPNDYTKEEAIKDGYIVIYNNNIISEDKNAIDEFIKNASNSVEKNIRILEFNDSFADCDYCITDIVFKDGMYEVTQMEIGENAYFKYPRVLKCANMVKTECDLMLLYTIENRNGCDIETYNICSIYK